MKKTIVIIDDFENSLFVTGMTIERAGYSIFKADTAKKALDYIKAGNKVELIITDYNMPDKNGLQFIKEVKVILGNLSVPIFVLSTENKEEIKKEVMSAGASLWIRKPFNTEQLIQYIKRAIG